MKRKTYTPAIPIDVCMERWEQRNQRNPFYQASLRKDILGKQYYETSPWPWSALYGFKIYLEFDRISDTVSIVVKRRIISFVIVAIAWFFLLCTVGFIVLLLMGNTGAEDHWLAFLLIPILSCWLLWLDHKFEIEALNKFDLGIRKEFGI